MALIFIATQYEEVENTITKICPFNIQETDCSETKIEHFIGKQFDILNIFVQNIVRTAFMLEAPM